MVAETLMKKLYERNKDLETYHRQKNTRPRTANAVEESEPTATEGAEDESSLKDDLEILAQFK